MGEIPMKHWPTSAVFEEVHPGAIQDGLNVENDNDESKEQRTRQQRHDLVLKGTKGGDL